MNLKEQAFEAWNKYGSMYNCLRRFDGTWVGCELTNIEDDIYRKVGPQPVYFAKLEDGTTVYAKYTEEDAGTDVACFITEASDRTWTKITGWWTGCAETTFQSKSKSK
jgi:hypothetical protein